MALSTANNQLKRQMEIMDFFFFTNQLLSLEKYSCISISDINIFLQFYFISVNSSLPCVVHSPSEPNKSTTPVSTLMPGMIPFFFNRSTNGVPSAHFWYNVSWKRITPEIFSHILSSVVNNNSRYARRFSSLFSVPISVKRLPKVEITKRNLFNIYFVNV